MCPIKQECVICGKYLYCQDQIAFDYQPILGSLEPQKLGTEDPKITIKD
jgi:hypothetical protein